MKALLLALLLSGCAFTWKHDREPAKDIRVHYVADSQGICRQIVGRWDIYLGCAWWNTRYSSCDIFLPSGAPQFVLNHEMEHCKGEDHWL